MSKALGSFSILSSPKEETKTFSDRRNPRGFITARPALQEILKGVQVEMK
jgi:hypothetical protein